MTDKIIIKSNGESLEINPKFLDIEKLRSQAIESAVNLLNIENIAYIIYVDDKFDPVGQKEEYKARLKELKREGSFITSEKFNNIDWTGPIIRFESQIVELWDGFDDKKRLLYEVCTHINDEESANVIPALDIENCFGDRVKLMTPDEWFKDEYKLIKALEGNEKALCLFDFEFHSGNSLLEGKNGAQLAKNLIEMKELSEKIVCGIFSHKFSEMDEDEYRLKYAEDYAIELTKFYTISKFRFTFDPKINAFVEGIKNLLLHPYVEKLKIESLEVLKESNKKASDKIEMISPKTFNQIIQKSSLKEGVWEIGTLFRLYGILSKEENYNIISSSVIRQKFNDSIKKIREIDLTETGYNSKTANQQLIDLRNSELYLQGDIINKLHLPIANGDIFTINDKDYILLVQPCNLAIRAKEKECGIRNKNYNNAFLIPIQNFAKDKLNHTKNEILSPTNSVDKILCAYFPEFKILSLDFLDLTVFNENGQSFIDMKEPTLDNEVIHFPWKKRYECIFEKIVEIETRIQSFIKIKTSLAPKIDELKEKIRALTNDFANLQQEEKNRIKEEVQPIKDEKKGIEDHIKNLENNIYSIENFENFKLNSVKNYDVVHKTFTFKIKRVKHYKSPYSDDLLQNFMLYLSRNAFDHDFTNS
jgi:FtsZ-binding cell division protein ZapB